MALVYDVQDLCLEQQHSFVNDFGHQLEVSAHSSFSKGQKSVCDMQRLVRSIAPLCPVLKAVDESLN